MVLGDGANPPRTASAQGIGIHPVRGSGNSVHLLCTWSSFRLALISGKHDVTWVNSGGRYWTRTSDPRRVKAVLYQLS